jgi:hypothetical protein
VSRLLQTHCQRQIGLDITARTKSGNKNLHVLFADPEETAERFGLPAA